MINRDTVSDKTIMYAGCTTEYLKDMLRKTEKHITFDAIILNGTNVAGTKAEGLPQISLKDASQYSNALIVIAQESLKQIKESSDLLRGYGLQYDHIANYGTDISLQILDAMGYKDYVDFNSNHITYEEINKNGEDVIKIASEQAKNNVVKIKKASVAKKMLIALFGKNGMVSFGNSSCNQAILQISTNGKIEVGDDCMLSHDILLSQTDQHLIFDMKTCERINVDKNIKVGNHVWIGRSAQILGGASIPDNCIIGQSTVTSGSYEEKNCVIAGCPGKVIRSNIIWARDSQETDLQTYDLCQDKSALKYIDDESNSMLKHKLAPHMVAAVKVEDKIIVSWEKVAKTPLFYRIYRKLNTERDWKTIGETESNYYIEEMTVDENAIYTVRAVYENGISDYERNGISVNSCLDLDHGTMK